MLQDFWLIYGRMVRNSEGFRGILWVSRTFKWISNQSQRILEDWPGFLRILQGFTSWFNQISEHSSNPCESLGSLQIESKSVPRSVKDRQRFLGISKDPFRIVWNSEGSQGFLAILKVACRIVMDRRGLTKDMVDPQRSWTSIQWFLPAALTPPARLPQQLGLLLLLLMVELLFHQDRWRRLSIVIIGVGLVFGRSAVMVVVMVMVASVVSGRRHRWRGRRLRGRRRRVEVETAAAGVHILLGAPPRASVRFRSVLRIQRQLVRWLIGQLRVDWRVNS